MLARHFGAPGFEVDKTHLRVLVQVGGGGRQGAGGGAALAFFSRFQRLAQLRWSNCRSAVCGLECTAQCACHARSCFVLTGLLPICRKKLILLSKYELLAQAVYGLEALFATIPKIRCRQAFNPFQRLRTLPAQPPRSAPAMPINPRLRQKFPAVPCAACCSQSIAIAGASG